jgi:acetyl-CoA carboxylase biotin carboxyl carrier protein
MSEPRDELQAIELAAAELVPDLAERLARHGLGEIEISRGDLRVRVAITGTGTDASPATIATVAAARSTASARTTASAQRTSPPGALSQGATGSDGAARSAQGVTAPAVGYFVYADGLGPGLEVQKGDLLGHVEVLGVAHDVLAPRSGSVRNLVTETGEAVEYGQVVIELEVPA